MKNFIDWYAQPDDNHGSWALTQAMMTIAKAHPTKGVKEGAPPTERTAQDEGRLTWLLDLKAGKPFVERLACPLSSPPKQLTGKDWTKYEGLIHTDHSVREELFDPRAERATRNKPPLLDFTYLYDVSHPDFTEFTAGRIFSEEEVFADIDREEEWAHREGDYQPVKRSDAEAAEVAELLIRCLRWEEIGD